ncbi:MAG: SRPBCC family protein [Eudoraea sp.]|nr:SRPBCC family protein [Eudoraea sp.]
MEITAPTQTLGKSAEEVYDFLNELSNIEKLMPEDLEAFEVTGDDSLFFVLKGMPKIYLERGEYDRPSKLVLQSSREAYEFHIAAQIDAVDESQCEVIFEFQGNFNMLMAMMIKTPITNLINAMAENLQKLS